MSRSALHRRQFLFQSGLGSLALGTLLAEESERAPQPHFAPSADSIIYLFMAGGPSQVDTFDPKPELAKLTARAIPNTTLVEFPELGHAPQMQEPQTFHKALLEGMARCCGR